MKWKYIQGIFCFLDCDHYIVMIHYHYYWIRIKRIIVSKMLRSRLKHSLRSFTDFLCNHFKVVIITTLPNKSTKCLPNQVFIFLLYRFNKNSKGLWDASNTKRILLFAHIILQGSMTVRWVSSVFVITKFIAWNSPRYYCMQAKNRRKFFALGIYHGKTNRFIGKRFIVYGVKVLIRKMTRNRFYFKTTITYIRIVYCIFWNDTLNTYSRKTNIWTQK